MADRKICDNCGKLPALTHRYFIERENDGNEMSNRYGYIDLCHEHAMALLHDLDYATGPRIKLIEQMRRIRQ